MDRPTMLALLGIDSSALPDGGLRARLKAQQPHLFDDDDDRPVRAPIAPVYDQLIPDSASRYSSLPPPPKNPRHVVPIGAVANITPDIRTLPRWAAAVPSVRPIPIFPPVMPPPSPIASQPPPSPVASQPPPSPIAPQPSIFPEGSEAPHNLDLLQVSEIYSLCKNKEYYRARVALSRIESRNCMMWLQGLKLIATISLRQAIVNDDPVALTIMEAYFPSLSE